MKRYYIVGYYGYQNAGDDAMLMGICDELNRRKVPYKFYFKGDSIWKVIKNIVECDVITIGGGTHLRNWGKGWLLQGLRIITFGIFCRIFSKQFHMWNVGIDGARWEWISRKVCNFISIRDRETFDSAVLMNWTLPNTTKRKIFGINITPVNSIYFNDQNTDKTKLYNMIQGIRLSDYKDWTIRFISLNGNIKYSDKLIFDHDIIIQLFHGYSVEFIEYENNPISTLNSIAECSLFLGMRYHANVFAYMAAIPKYQGYTPNSYPSVTNFRNSIPIEQAKELARAGIRTE